MNTKTLEKLCCPTCRGELDLRPFAEPGSDDGEGPGQGSDERFVEDGVLLCPGCGVWYPLFSYVPVMLVFETSFHRWFAERYGEQIRRLAGYKLPNRPPQPGERSVQETFTDEWDEVQEDELSFTYSEEDLVELNREAWLKWLGGSGQVEVKSILDVGCGGLGRESLVLQKVAGGDAEVFGIDLNFALLRSSEAYKLRPGVHFVIASLFNLPFRPSSFDLVYSEGVLHHTFSTVEAFRSIASYVRKGGYLFVWVYGLDDHLVVWRRGAKSRFFGHIHYIIEGVTRPLISRSPKALRDAFFGAASAALHPFYKRRVMHKEKWKLNNTNHHLRDWLSPRFARRHSYNEVLEWFENLDFEVIDVQSPSAYRRLFKLGLFGVGMTGKKA